MGGWSSSYNPGGSEYDAVNRSDYIDIDSYTSGYEKDADIELQESMTLQSLRKTSANLMKNNFMAYGISQAFVNAIMGGPLVTKIKYPDKAIESKLNKLLEETLTGVNLDGTISLRSNLEQQVTGAIEKGDILILFVHDEDSEDWNDVKIELIEASRIQTPRQFQQDPEVVEGVKYSKGKVVGYYVRKLQSINSSKDMDDISNFTLIPVWKEWKGSKIRVARLIHCQMNRRPNMTRMYPLVTPLMGLLRYFNQVFEAVLISIRVAACFVGVLHSDNPEGSLAELDKTGDPDRIKGMRSFPIKPGTMNVAPEGAKGVTFSSPNRPSDNLNEFFKLLNVYVGFTMRFPYSGLFQDLEKSNFSNSKMGAIETERMTFRWHEALLPCVQEFMVLLLKQIRGKGLVRFSMKQVIIDIRFPKFSSLDQEKTARANKLDLESNVTSESIVCENNNISWDKVQEDKDKEAIRSLEREAAVLVRKKELEKELGIEFPEDKEKEKDTRDTTGSRRQGENTDKELTDNEKKERRKQDGN